MQSLFWRFAILVAVIATSCAVVYQAHRSLSKSDTLAAQSFEPVANSTPPATNAPLAVQAPAPVIQASSLLGESKAAPTHSLAGATFSKGKSTVSPSVAAVSGGSRSIPSASAPDPLSGLAPAPQLTHDAGSDSSHLIAASTGSESLAGPGPFAPDGTQSSGAATESASQASGLPAWAAEPSPAAATPSTTRAPLQLDLDAIVDTPEASPPAQTRSFPEQSPPAHEAATGLFEAESTGASAAPDALTPLQEEATTEPHQAPSQSEASPELVLPGEIAPSQSESPLASEGAAFDPFATPAEPSSTPAPRSEAGPTLDVASDASNLETVPLSPLTADQPTAGPGLINLPESVSSAEPAQTPVSESGDDGEYVIRQRATSNGVQSVQGSQGLAAPVLPEYPAAGAGVPRAFAQAEAAPVPLPAPSAQIQDPFGAEVPAADGPARGGISVPEQSPPARPNPFFFNDEEVAPSREPAPRRAPASDLPVVIPGRASQGTTPAPQVRPSAAAVFPQESAEQPAAFEPQPNASSGSLAPSSPPVYDSGIRSIAAEPQENSHVSPAAVQMEPAGIAATVITGTGEFDPSVPSVPQRPELQIEKVAPAEADLGEPIIYSIFVRNVGQNIAHNVIVEDRVPRGTELDGTSPQAYEHDGKLIWKFESLKPQEEKKIMLKVIPRQPGEVGSVATVSFSTSVAARIKVSAPQLTIQLHSPAEAIVGEEVSFRFHIRNEGSGDARNVWLRTVLPPGLRHPGGDDIEYELGIIPAGESREVDLILAAIEPGPMTAQAMLTIDGETKANSQTQLRIIESRIKVVRTGPQRRFVGRPAAFTTKVMNESAKTLENVKIVETLPKGVELSTIPQHGVYDGNQRTITWLVRQLAPGQSVELQNQIVAKEAGNHAGKLLATDDSGNSAEIATEMNVKGFADLDIDVEQSPAQPVAAGEQVSLKMVIKNEGSAAATNVQAAFELPEQMSFINARSQSQFNQSGRTVTFAVGTLAVGEQQSIDLVLVAAEQAQEGNVKVKAHLKSAESETPLLTEEELRIFRDGQ